MFDLFSMFFLGMSLFVVVFFFTFAFLTSFFALLSCVFSLFAIVFFAVFFFPLFCFSMNIPTNVYDYGNSYTSHKWVTLHTYR